MNESKAKALCIVACAVGLATGAIPFLGCSSSNTSPGAAVAIDDAGADAATDCPEVVAQAGDDPCTAPLAPGSDRKCEFTFKGEKRKFFIYAPANYNPCVATPLIVDVHGASETAEMHAGLKAFPGWPDGLGSGWRVVADKEGFVVVTPQGSDDFQTNQDLDFLFKVEQMAAATMNVDAAKVYMTGISNGGFFTYATACADKSGVFAGFAPVSGGSRSSTCALSKPTPYIGFNAKTDTVIDYQNGVEGATLWAKTNHCKSGPTPSLTFGGPNTDPRTLCLSSGPGLTKPFKLSACSTTTTSISTCQTWDQCDGGVKTTFCSVNGERQLVGGHILYFNDTHLSLAAVAWEFFKGTL